MRKIILNLAVSLDGYIEGPNGEYDWCIMDDDMDFNGFLNRVDTIFFGRRSYEVFSRYTPSPGAPPEEQALYAITQAKKKYVFSYVLTSDDPSITVIKGPFHERVKALKQEPGKDIWLYGGANLITSFVNTGLIDEYHLSVHPIILGAGKPLFTDILPRVGLTLKETKTYRSGVVGLFYSK